MLNKMDILNYNYDINSSVCIANPAPPNDVLQVYSISYPMLGKSVSKAGFESPTGNSTNVLILTRDGVESEVEIAEGFPTHMSLISSINNAINQAFNTVVDPLRLVTVGDSQAQWVNQDNVSWTIEYPNPETKQLVRGDLTGLLTETIAAGDETDIFVTDSRLGMSQIELKLMNGQSVSLPSSGKWMDHVFYSFGSGNYLPRVNFTSNREVKLIARYNSLRITKELVCPKTDGILISTIV